MGGELMDGGDVAWDAVSGAREGVGPMRSDAANDSGVTSEPSSTPQIAPRAGFVGLRGKFGRTVAEG